ncbi:MAG: PKD domain-containing protein [Gaiellaceae bacterium]
MAVVIVAILGGAAAAALPATLYVDGGNSACSDTASGSPSQPFCTIGAAAARVTAGGTVQVAAGTYRESVTVAGSGTSTAPVTFTAAPGATVTVTGGVNGFAISGRSWVTVTGFGVTKTSDYGIAVSNSSHITLADNHVSYAGQPVSGLTKYGIRLNNVSDSLVSGNVTDHNTNAGIGLVSGSTRNEVRGNDSFANAQGWQRAAAGIYLFGAPDNTIDSNTLHDNEDSGLNCFSASNNCLIYDNVTYDNGDHGIDNYQVTGVRVVANTVFNNVTAGINIEAGSTGATIANNISVDNGIGSPRTHGDIRVESGSTAGTKLDYDLVFLTQTDTVLIWNSVNYKSLAAFQSATGQEAHGVQADARWQNAAAGDFHLTAGSPAIDAANSGVSAQPATDVEGNARVDDPATPDTGAGAPPYADRGAYELQAGPLAEAAPVARVAAGPSSGTAPLTVTADASGSTDGDATPIAGYTFDFGDGSATIGPGGAPTATHTYSATGTYTVTVTVTDTAGLVSTATVGVQVTAPAPDAPPTASLAVTPASGAINLSVTADGSASADADSTPIAGYTFDFGDGSAPTGVQASPRATHTYTVVGTYTVRMTVKDTAGLASTATAQVAAVDNAPTVALKVTPTNGTAPLAVTASATATDGDATPVKAYTFDFGDGAPPIGPQSAASANHTYSAAGTYNIVVTVNDTAGLASTAKRQVKVR